MYHGCPAYQHTTVTEERNVAQTVPKSAQNRTQPRLPAESLQRDITATVKLEQRKVRCRSLSRACRHGAGIEGGRHYSADRFVRLEVLEVERPNCQRRARDAGSPIQASGDFNDSSTPLPPQLVEKLEEP
jgi:non-canonical (house-cleaning) NTP pyrophosphatase